MTERHARGHYVAAAERLLISHRGRAYLFRRGARLPCVCAPGPDNRDDMKYCQGKAGQLPFTGWVNDHP